MSYRVLWPVMRWPEGREIEIASMGEIGQAEFCNSFAEVTDEQWANCDAIVSAPDVPAEYRARLEKCRIFVTPKVGFDNIDLAGWGELAYLCVMCRITAPRKWPTTPWRCCCR